MKTVEERVADVSPVLVKDINVLEGQRTPSGMNTKQIKPCLDAAS